MANYRAITQYYNSSRIDLNHIIIPNQAATTSNRSLIYPATSLLALSNMTQLRHLLPQNLATRTEFDSTLESVRLYQQDRQDKSNFYPNLKPNYLPKNDSGSTPNWTNSSAAIWNNVNSNYNSVKKQPSNSSDSSDSSDVFMTVEDSGCEKIVRLLSLEESNLRKLLINKTAQKFNLSFGPEALNRKLSRHLIYCDYLNPFSCEFCAIADRRNNKDTELIELRILLNTFKSNPYELTDGIKNVLTWPWEKCTNNLSTVDGLTSFYQDDQKRKVKESFPNIVMDLSDSTSKNFCSGGPPFIPTPKVSNHQIRNCNACSQLYSQALILQAKPIDTKAPEKKEEIFKLPTRQDNPNPTKTIPSGPKTSDDNQQSELEYLRNRMAEFICIGPLSNKWYMESFWSTERPRMPYTRNFVSTTAPTTAVTQSESIRSRERPSYIQNFAQVPRTSNTSVDSNFGMNQGDGDKANLSNEQIITQEKINEILLRRAQLKPRK